MFVLIRDILVILLPIMAIGFVLAACQKVEMVMTIMMLMMVFSRLWDKCLEWLGIISVFIGIFFPYIAGIVLFLIVLFSND